jgi:hypothetical protein
MCLQFSGEHPFGRTIQAIGTFLTSLMTFKPLSPSEPTIAKSINLNEENLVIYIGISASSD